jgi:hypothetical protein
MSFILPMNVLRIQDELKEYRKLCNAYNHSPAKQEFEDIVNFILLHSGDGINESFEGVESIEDINEATKTYLYIKFNESLNEKGGGGHLENSGEEEWNSAVDATVGTAKKITKGLVIGAALTALYIAFLFKRGKIKSSLKQEQALEMKKLDQFGELAKLKTQYAEMTGKEMPKMSAQIPSMSEGPEMEKPSKPGDE